MEYSDACTFSEGEEVIFDDGKSWESDRIVLSNKRLIFLQVKGMINKSYTRSTDVFLKDVESARSDPKSKTILLQLKDGQGQTIEFRDSTSFWHDLLSAPQPGEMELRLQATIDRWVNEINRLASGTRNLPEMIYCRYCGAKNKSINTKCEHCGALLS